MKYFSVVPALHLKCFKKRSKEASKQTKKTLLGHGRGRARIMIGEGKTSEKIQISPQTAVGYIEGNV